MKFVSHLLFWGGVAAFTACQEAHSTQATETAILNAGDRGKESTSLTAEEEAVAAAVNLKADMPTEEKKRIVENITKEYLMGKFDPSKDERFATIPATYSAKEETQYMRKEALESFKKMHDDAKKAGVNLKILSACRPFNIQKSIWEAKWQGKRKVGGEYVSQSIPDKDKSLQILRWNSMPSTSRHHWGTDIDINAVEPAYFDKSPGKEEYAWLVANAHQYGFCQVYSPKGADRPEGYEEEKWHWSYLPVASELIREYERSVKDSDISGFMGSATAQEIGVVGKYVLGINPKCKE